MFFVFLFCPTISLFMCLLWLFACIWITVSMLSHSEEYQISARFCYCALQCEWEKSTKKSQYDFIRLVSDQMWLDAVGIWHLICLCCIAFHFGLCYNSQVHTFTRFKLNRIRNVQYVVRKDGATLWVLDSGSWTHSVKIFFLVFHTREWTTALTLRIDTVHSAFSLSYSISITDRNNNMFAYW